MKLTGDMTLHALGAAGMCAVAAVAGGLAAWPFGRPLWGAFAAAAIAAGPVVWWWRRREIRQSKTKASGAINRAEWVVTIPAVVLFAVALGGAAFVWG